MPSVSLNGIEMHYETAGEGAPLLLLAGLASDNASWGPVVAPLGERFRLIMPDNRNAGRTRPMPAPASIDLMAADAIVLIDKLGFERVDVLGHSMGGLIALRVAARAPERAGRLIIAASSAEGSPRNLELLTDLLELRRAGVPLELWFRQFFYWLFAKPFFADPAAVAEAARLSAGYEHLQPLEGFAAQIALLKETGSCDPSRIAAETLILCAEHDLLFSVEEIALSFAEMKDHRIEVVAGAGHSLHWDNPGDFVRRVTEFLGDRG